MARIHKNCHNMLAGCYLASFLAGCYLASFLAGCYLACFLAGCHLASFLAGCYLASFLAGCYLASFLADCQLSGWTDRAHMCVPAQGVPPMGVCVVGLAEVSTLYTPAVGVCCTMQAQSTQYDP
eukprot:364078-Chlamydomonas_euryale.AAC.2